MNVQPNHQAPSPHQAPAASSKKNLIIIMVAIGCALLVASGLLFFLLSGGGQDAVGPVGVGDNSQDDNEDQPTAGGAVVTQEESSDASAGADDDQTASTASNDSSDTADDTSPNRAGIWDVSSFLSRAVSDSNQEGVSLDSSADDNAESQSVLASLSGAADADAIARERQELVAAMAEVGITEAEIADFLAAYDYLTDPTTAEQLEQLDAASYAALDEALGSAIEGHIAALFACIILLDDADLTESSLTTALVPCVVETLNDLGRDLLEITQAALEEE